MPKELACFLLGLSFGLGIIFFVPAKVEVVQPDTKQFDSLLTEKDERIRELNIFVDSIIDLTSKVDTFYYELEENLNKHYENVDTISNADTLINQIKWSIHNRRTKTD